MTSSMSVELALPSMSVSNKTEKPVYDNPDIIENPQKEEDEENQDSILMDELVANELEPNEPRENLKGKTLEELQILLEEAVTNEDYEKAAHIRDEISKRE